MLAADAAAVSSSRSIDVRAALGALKALVQNPDDTAQVFRIIRALSGDQRRLVRRMRETARGRSLLDGRPDLLTRLLDRERLATLPEGSLGRAYLAFVEAEGITADGLVAASKEGRADTSGFSPEALFFADRMRDTHDLWHTVTGYRGDLIGEAALLAFTFAQTQNPGIGLIVAMAIARGAVPSVRSFIARGFLRGLRAAWLPAVHWEELLPLPLETVRARLRVGPPPAYEPYRSFQYFAEGRAA